MHMEMDDVSYCGACESAMDVTMLSPYTNAQCPSCGALNRVKTDLGSYTLTKRVGTGGMSLVFRATDVQLGRNVAIKILNEEFSMDQQRIAQFEQEAKITAAISHPHCVRVYTVGQAFRRFYIAMELVAGGSLEELMQDGEALDEGRMLAVAMQVNNGLDAAYQSGLIHRDIKPGNILFDTEGNVKIVDFGLALVTQGGAAKAEEIWATPYYVSPETLDNLEEDFRSDMYALGATLYHALSGVPPFTVETRSTTELKKIKQTIPRLKKVAPWLSKETCYVVDRAMAFAPKDRFKSYREMYAALEAAENVARSTVSAPSDSAKVATPQTPRDPLKQWLIPASLVAVFLLIVALWKYTGDRKEEAELASSLMVSGEEENQELWLAIGKEYNSAQDLMRRGNYKDAGLKFAGLMRNETVVEPTVSLVCLQATISSLLDGRSWEARKTVSEKMRVDKQNDQRDDVDKVLSGRIQQGMERLMVLDPVRPVEVDQKKDPVGYILTFASALKNWEQGSWNEAVELFETVRKTRLNDDIRELQYYKSISQNYLNDYKTLKPFLKGMAPKSIKEVKETQTKINAMAKKLQTRGRAQFQVRAWREQLERYNSQFTKERAEQNRQNQKEREQAQRKNEADFEELKQKVRNATRLRNFARVSRLLHGAEVDSLEKQQWIEQQLYLAKGADEFIRSIEYNTLEKEFYFSGASLQGEEFERVKGSSAKGLIVESEQGDKVLAWKDLTNDTMLALYSATKSEDTSEEEEMQRLEYAIGFAWLIGEYEKAQLAATTLIAQAKDDAFAKRWALLTEGTELDHSDQ